MIWGDNAPYFYHANTILELIDLGSNTFMDLTGNSPGGKMLKRSDKLREGTFV